MQLAVARCLLFVGVVVCCLLCVAWLLVVCCSLCVLRCSLFVVWCAVLFDVKC